MRIFFTSFGVEHLCKVFSSSWPRDTNTSFLALLEPWKIFFPSSSFHHGPFETTYTRYESHQLCLLLFSYKKITRSLASNTRCLTTFFVKGASIVSFLDGEANFYWFPTIELWGKFGRFLLSTSPWGINNMPWDIFFLRECISFSNLCTVGYVLVLEEGEL